MVGWTSDAPPPPPPMDDWARLAHRPNRRERGGGGKDDEKWRFEPLGWKGGEEKEVAKRPFSAPFSPSSINSYFVRNVFLSPLQLSACSWTKVKALKKGGLPVLCFITLEPSHLFKRLQFRNYFHVLLSLD